jgi:hypothetical protein
MFLEYEGRLGAQGVLSNLRRKRCTVWDHCLEHLPGLRIRRFSPCFSGFFYFNTDNQREDNSGRRNRLRGVVVIRFLSYTS